MNNDKTKSRQRKGREPSEKAVFLRRYVRRRLLAAKLWNQIAICRVVTTTIFSNLRNSSNSWLANQEGAEMEGVT